MRRLLIVLVLSLHLAGCTSWQTLHDLDALPTVDRVRIAGRSEDPSVITGPRLVGDSIVGETERGVRRGFRLEEVSRIQVRRFSGLRTTWLGIALLASGVAHLVIYARGQVDTGGS